VHDSTKRKTHHGDAAARRTATSASKQSDIQKYLMKKVRGSYPAEAALRLPRFVVEVGISRCARELTGRSRLRHKYQQATLQYGCQAAAIFSICLGEGRLRFL
jgi:hypothetical protein